MSRTYQIIEGHIFSDERGLMACVNEFSLNRIVRLYEIAPKNPSVIRAWQAHKKESKWFYCTQGMFHIRLVKLDSFDNPSDELQVHSIELNANDPKVLYIPRGYANGFKAIKESSKLMVFSDFNLDESKEDDYRFEPTKWIEKW